MMVKSCSSRSLGDYDDLVNEILARLPVKSLLRFKCVDRSWDSLLKTPNFITKHLKLHKEKGDASIMCFDFCTNQFSTLQIPTTAADPFALCYHWHTPFLDELNNSLAYVVPCFNTYFEAEIWILERDGCWNKKFKFGQLARNVEMYTIWKDGAEFIGSPELEEGEIFDADVISYNSDCHPVRHYVSGCPMNGFYKIYRYYVRKYVESLTPLFS
ncbi:hypothetical protein RIF29_27779 [Crotalaria pallida]|uniref:F-box domain-containing protein n=1 Tax=Crotalaria pallida TaxID=3830 RepID=A0AAN9ES27_CROPI